MVISVKSLFDFSRSVLRTIFPQFVGRFIIELGTIVPAEWREFILNPTSSAFLLCTRLIPNINNGCN